MAEESEDVRKNKTWHLYTLITFIFLINVGLSVFLVVHQGMVFYDLINFRPKYSASKKTFSAKFSQQNSFFLSFIFSIFPFYFQALSLNLLFLIPIFFHLVYFPFSQILRSRFFGKSIKKVWK